MMGSQGAVDDVGVMEAGLALTPAARGTSNNPRHSCAGRNPATLSLREHEATGSLPAQG